MTRSLHRRILVPTAMLAVVVVAALSGLAWRGSVEATALEREVTAVRTASALAGALADATHEEERWLLAIRFRPDAPSVRRLAQADAQNEALVARLSALALRPRAQELWSAYLGARAPLAAARDALVRAAAAGEDRASALAFDRWRLVADRSDALLDSFTTYHVRHLERAVAALQRRQRAALGTALAAVAAGVLLAGAFALLLARAVVQPIVAMAATAERIADGRALEPVAGAERRDELGTLARAFNRMTERLVGANAEQAAAIRHRDDFLALLGHELRNPLGAIVAASELVARRGPADDSHAEVIRRQARQLSRIVDDLLDVARVTTGRIELRRAAVDLRALAAAHVAAAAPAARSAGVALEGPAPGAPVVVDGDAARLEQIVANLVGNALKFTPQGGRVEVSVDAIDRRAVLTVRDDGTGIAPELLPNVFDLFRQAPTTLDRSRGGLGLGLTLVRNLAELHGGDVSASSDGPGRGSIFTVCVPLAEAGAVAPESPQRAAPRAGALRVLLVEDHEDNRETLRELVALLGHQVVTASDGAEGVERALADAPDVALVDIGLPGIDGYEVARRIRAAAGKAIRLIALTGYGQPEDRERALAAGFDLHLTKPLDPDALARLLADLAASVARPAGAA